MTAAARTAVAAIVPQYGAQSDEPIRVHASPEEYGAWVDDVYIVPSTRWTRKASQRDFINKWPNLEEWFALPLRQRMEQKDAANANSRSLEDNKSWLPYLIYLSLVKGVPIDYQFLFSRSFTGPFQRRSYPHGLGIDHDYFGWLLDQQLRIGYVNSPDQHANLSWALSRAVLHRADPDPRNITMADLSELNEALIAFDALLQTDDVRADYRRKRRTVEPTYNAATHARARLYALHNLLFQIGQIGEPPRMRTTQWGNKRSHFELYPSGMRSLMERYVATMNSSGRYREQTIRHTRDATRRLVEWLKDEHPRIVSFDELTRTHAEAFLTHLATVTNSRTGKLLAVSTVKDTVACLSRVFADISSWEWDGAPAYPIFTRHDIPRLPKAVPRFIPKDQLASITEAIRELKNPYQRAALLTARWTGARRDEIRRLEVDCLDTYPDGHPRLRLPAGKTRRERIIPLHPEAADALNVLVEKTKSASVRTRYDAAADRDVRFLFSYLGRLPSSAYLFDDAIRTACKTANLMHPDGRPIITMHRFRHSVGTELAEGGAQLHTIMAVLGHTSPAMSMVYASVADPIVRTQYEEVIERDGGAAIIAGPAADALRNNQLDDRSVDWLKTNFIKTELELGHCLRTPAEGPCECDLMLSCSKFLTSSKYLPRLRERCDVEDALSLDALHRGRDREVERHTTIKARLQGLIADLERLA